MPRAGDVSDDAIGKLGNPAPIRVRNNGRTLLELWLEPYGQDYWLQPGEAVIVISYGQSHEYPFHVEHEPDRITIWATTFHAKVTDSAGNEVPGAHQRPKGKCEA